MSSVHQESMPSVHSSETGGGDGSVLNVDTDAYPSRRLYDVACMLVHIGILTRVDMYEHKYQSEHSTDCSNNREVVLRGLTHNSVSDTAGERQVMDSMEVVVDGTLHPHTDVVTSGNEVVNGDVIANPTLGKGKRKNPPKAYYCWNYMSPAAILSSVNH